MRKYLYAEASINLYTLEQRGWMAARHPTPLSLILSLQFVVTTFLEAGNPWVASRKVEAELFALTRTQRLVAGFLIRCFGCIHACEEDRCPACLFIIGCDNP